MHWCFWNKKKQTNWSKVSCFANYRLQICVCQTSSNRPCQSKALFLALANTFIMYTTRIFDRRSLPINDLKWPVHVLKLGNVRCCSVCLLSPNRYFQFHSSIMKTHAFTMHNNFQLDKQEMNSSAVDVVVSSFFYIQFALRVVLVHSSQALSTIYISYWMALKRESSPTLSFRSPYADHFVKKSNSFFFV